MKQKFLFPVFLLVTALFTAPLTAYANGCEDICGPNGPCLSRCLQVIQSMVTDINGQVCKSLLNNPGQETAAYSCHNAVQQVLARMLK